jgi:hypothetical protein
MMRRFSRWLILGVTGISPLLIGAEGGGCSGPPMGGTGGTGGGNPRPTPCVSSLACGAGEYCTTEQGACNRPPGCGPNDVCPDVCYGVCRGRCTPQDATPVGACKRFLGYKRDGQACTPLGGCSCRGADCDNLYPDAESCAAAIRACFDSCKEQDANVHEYLAANRSCTTDADCTTVTLSCLSGGFCGSHYANDSIDRAQLQRLEGQLNQCVNGDPNRGCVTCLALPPPPACVSGVCQSSSPDPNPDPPPPTYDCDLSTVLCDALEPVCPAGSTPSVKGGCYGPCVPIEQCKCSPDVPTACPEDYVCWRFAGRCGPYVN